MSNDPYKAAPSIRVADAVTEMAARHIGSVLVTDDNDRLLGIFTDTDALRVLAGLLNH